MHSLYTVQIDFKTFEGAIRGCRLPRGFAESPWKNLSSDQNPRTILIRGFEGTGPSSDKTYSFYIKLMSEGPELFEGTVVLTLTGGNSGSTRRTRAAVAGKPHIQKDRN